MMGSRILSTAVGILLILLCCENNAAKKFKRPDFCTKRESRQQRSFLWMVKRQPPSYFYGTIHVPYTRVWEFVPDNVKRAMESVDNVFFELDLMNPDTIASLTNCQMLPPGQHLKDILPKDLYQRLKRHLDYVKEKLPLWMTADQRGRGLYADYLFNAIAGNWEKKRPVWVMMMVNTLTESDVKGRGIPVLDLYLAQMAEQMGKRTGAVEEVDEQCVPLNGLIHSQVIFALNHTLHQQENIRLGKGRGGMYTSDDLVRHYNCGDIDAVVFNQDSAQVPTLVNRTLTTDELSMARQIDEYFREELIYKRNDRMAERVVQLMETNPDQSFFFAFGAGHFVGNHTIIDVLNRSGLRIEHIGPEQKIKRIRRKQRHRTVLPRLSLLRDFDPFPNAIDTAGPVEVTEGTFSRRSKLRGRESRMSQNSTNDNSAAPATRKHRNFNDLWVRLDPNTMGSHETPSADALAVQESLRLWYGLPPDTSIHNTGASFKQSLLYLLSTCICLIITFVPRVFDFLR